MRGLVTLDERGNMHDASRVTVDDETVLLLGRARDGNRLHSARLAETVRAFRWILLEDTIQRHPRCLTFEVQRMPFRDWPQWERPDLEVFDDQVQEVTFTIRVAPMGLPVADPDDVAGELEEAIHRLGPIVPPGVARQDAWMVTSTNRLHFQEA